MATLNLGFEHLTSNVIDNYSKEELVDMAFDCQILSDKIDSLFNVLDETYRGIVNAQHVKKVLNKYGRTKSLVAMVGSENLDVIASMEDATSEQMMEDNEMIENGQVPRSTEAEPYQATPKKKSVWQKIKDVCIAIINKIKEWWNKFLGLFKSRVEKLKKKIDGLNGKNENYNPPKEIMGLETSDFSKLTEAIDGKADCSDMELKTLKFNASAGVVTYGKLLLTKVADINKLNNEVKSQLDGMLKDAKSAKNEEDIKKTKEMIDKFKASSKCATKLINSAVSELYHAI